MLLKSERRDRRGYVCKLGDFGLSRCGGRLVLGGEQACDGAGLVQGLGRRWLEWPRHRCQLIPTSARIPDRCQVAG